MKAKVLMILVGGLLLGYGSVAQGVMTDWITIGDPGNPADSTGYGNVDYVYQIGQYEVTNSQYIEFLNAVASIEDPHDLYDPAMGGSVGGISRYTVNGGYSYGPKDADAAWLNRPVNFVTFWDACRYANWLHNGQSVGLQDDSTTEDGAYSLGGSTNPTNISISRNPDALVFIPTEDEWYKAAYYDATAGLYYTYPTAAAVLPSNDLVTSDPGDNANFYQDGFTLGPPYFTTEVGDFENSASSYGTFDQGGNVWEWTEATPYLVFRGIRGGSFEYDELAMRSTYERHNSPVAPGRGVGFRVAHIPEPATIALMLIGAATLLRKRRA